MEACVRTAGAVLFVWSHPRALSTALLRSLAELPNATTVLEPFMIPWQAEIGFLDRQRLPNPPSYEDIVENMKRGEYFTQAHQTLQVVKEMPCHVPPHVLEALLAEFPSARHVFLVRHPYRMIPSYFRAAAADAQPEAFTREIVLMDVSYQDLLNTAKRIPRESALFIDAEALLADPEATLRRLCEHVGVPFTPALLTWQPNAVPSSWRDLDHFEGWLDNVVGSSGWKPRAKEDGAIAYPATDDPFHRECIDVNMPVYEQLVQLQVGQ